MGQDEASDGARVIAELIEPQRRTLRMSVRAVAERAGMSETTWRQLAAGGAGGDPWIRRTERRRQLLDMANAVGCLPEVARRIDASPTEVAGSEDRVRTLDAGEAEIMTSSNFTDFERLELLKTLRRLRRSLKRE